MLETPNRDRRGERRAATREEILAAAWELCRPNGLAGLSLRDLAKAVGMRAPSLYSYFDSKHAIYDAMFAEASQAFIDAEAEVEYPGEPLGDLKALTHFFVGFCTADVVRYQLLFQRTIPGFAAGEAALRDRERLGGRLAGAVRLHRSHGPVGHRPDDGPRHRAGDIARATGRPLVLTAEHDGRIVADAVAEWSRRHGQPFTLTLEGPAGGTYTSGGGGEALHLDAVELCRTLSGRAQGAGLLTQPVPF